MEVFFSYAHKDEALRDELAKHLKLLERQGVITAWHDRDITAGEEWKDAINSHLESANIILLLVSSNFLASDYCYDIELKRALERHESSEAQVIPVILRSVDWKTSPFGKLTALPKNGEPITSSSWKNEDEAFTDVVKGLRRLIDNLRDGAPESLLATEKPVMTSQPDEKSAEYSQTNRYSNTAISKNSLYGETKVFEVSSPIHVLMKGSLRHFTGIAFLLLVGIVFFGSLYERLSMKPIKILIKGENYEECLAKLDQDFLLSLISSRSKELCSRKLIEQAKKVFKDNNNYDEAIRLLELIPKDFIYHEVEKSRKDIINLRGYREAKEAEDRCDWIGVRKALEKITDRSQEQQDLLDKAISKNNTGEASLDEENCHRSAIIPKLQ